MISKSELEDLVKDLRSYSGFQRKKVIHDLVKILPAPEKMYPWVISAFGEDAARMNPLSILPGRNDASFSDVLLLTHADAIIEELVDANPFAAGFSCVLVNLNDIYAAGGIPVYLTAVVSVKKNEMHKAEEIFRGISRGIELFDIPLVGGHVAPNCSYNAVSMACTGLANKDSAVSSKTAMAGDDILFAIDLEGERGKISPYSWNSLSKRSKEEIKKQKTIIASLGGDQMLTSCKDFSNPGLIGTTAMLLDVSGKGGVINLDCIPFRTDGAVSFKDWLKMFVSTGYVMTAKKANSAGIMSRMRDVGFACNVVGEVTTSKKMYLVREREKTVLIDFSKESVFGPDPLQS